MHFTRLHLLAAGLLSGPGLAAAGSVRHSRRGVECYYEVAAASGDTCESLAASWAVMIDVFIAINPGVTCPTLEAGKAYCVAGESTPDATSTSTSAQPQVTTTSTSTTIPSPTPPTSTTTPPVTPSNTPAMPGIAENCDGFYKIKSGDQCGSIAAGNGISIDQLKAWNAGINAECSNLWVDYYVCIHIPGAEPPSTTTAAPAPSNSPAMPGVAENCDGFYKIKSGDQCGTIASGNGISIDQLKAWNTGINAECSNLWVDYYVCIHIPGAAPPSTTTAAPAPSNSPALPGAVPNCNKWYKVASGDTCETISGKNAVTIEQFRKWNTQVNQNCNNLWLDYYTCVGVPGAATPMPGIVGNCNRYYEVVSGDGCDSIAAKHSIAQSSFRHWNPFINASCTNLWVNALVCTKAP
ncbi:carbohydrate-binding module family 50 protein [Trichocladium antarcticum]|uniref:Carbohydrate-binding module family 50 protein n=1 Tax=Trichocladium antarcticum TaxID=1450529 RepID=A0AAN6UQJ6_9PEZI|nr:carbohydrate-binding module family 50 protein [Trichocladium antarcticum]